MDFLHCSNDKEERVKTLVQIIEGLQGAIERAREAGLIDLVFQLTTVLDDAKRDLASLTKLNRPARMAPLKARRRDRAAPGRRAR